MNETAQEPRFLLFFAMLYTAIGIASLTLPYKLIGIGHFVTSGASVIMPFWYAIGDLIAEVYGYKIAKKLIGFSVISCLVYAILVSIMIATPDPVGWGHQSDFNYVFGSLMRATLGGDASVLVGAFLNAYFISKWKFLLHGKLFWLRSLGSSGIGETLQLIVACSIMYAFKMPFFQIIELIATILIIHFSVTFLIVFPNNLLVTMLKKKEPSIAYYSGGFLNFNPFKKISNDKEEVS